MTTEIRMAQRIILAALLVSFGLLAEEPASAPDAEKIKKLIKELSADDFETRERAMSSLEELGESAAPLWEKERLGSEDPEVRMRLGKLLARYRPGSLLWKFHAGTVVSSPAIVDERVYF